MRIASGSDLSDAGVGVNLTFTGGSKKPKKIPYLACMIPYVKNGWVLAGERKRQQGDAAVLSWVVMISSPLICLCINII